jgi:prophage regulatory protein
MTIEQINNRSLFCTKIHCSPSAFSVVYDNTGADGKLPLNCHSINYKSPKRIIRLRDVINRVGLCRASIYAKILEGSFPKQISLGPNSVGWLEEEVTAWIESRIQASRPEAAVRQPPQTPKP